MALRTTTKTDGRGAARRWLRALLFEDWTLKLLALAITLGLWYAVTTQRAPATKRLHDVPLEFLLPENIDIGNDPVDKVDVMLEGSQDNGRARREGTTWTSVGGGDSGPARFENDPVDGSKYAYFIDPPEAGETYFFASTDGGKTWSPTRPDDFSVPDLPEYTQFATHPTDPGRVVIGLDRVYERPSRSAAWRAVSPQLEGDKLVTALAYGRVAGTIIAAYGNGHVWRTTDGGGDGEDPSHWVRIDQGTVWGGRPAALLPDTIFPQILYLVSRGGRVWRTSTGGEIWENVTGALPAGLPIYSGVRPSLFSRARGALFIGTSMGVFVSRFQSASTCWVPYLIGMPEVKVSDLQEHVGSDSIAAATYGRGVYVAPLVEVTEPNLKLSYQRSEGCQPTAVVGAQVTLDAKVTGLAGAQFDWTVDGAVVTASGGQATVTLPDAPVPIHVAVTARGDACVLSGQADIVPFTKEQAIWFERLCNFRKWPHKLPNWPINPLGDPLRDRPLPGG